MTARQGVSAFRRRQDATRRDNPPPRCPYSTFPGYVFLVKPCGTPPPGGCRMRSFTERALPLLTAVGLGVLGPALAGCGGTSAPPATATTTPSSPAATSEPTREGGEEGPEE